jgi:predicted phospho-2-dehydro-3-deoxyheptonate aldolase
MIGKQIRLERIMDRKNGRTVIIPMDHGVSVGPIEGLENIACAVDKAAKGGANAVVLHKGMVGAGYRGSEGEGGDIGLIVHLSGSTGLSPHPNYKVLVTSVEEAVAYGADAVSIHVNVGSGREGEMLRDFGKVVAECNRYGIPLLAMMYPRGPNIDDKDPKKKADNIKIAARVGAELGADIIKTSYTGDSESFKAVVDGCSGIPVVAAGGSKMSEDEALVQVYDVIQAGAAGLCMGRNAFQSQDPVKFIKAACSIVHDGKTAEEAKQYLHGR